MLGPSNDKVWELLKVKPDFDSYKDRKTTLNGMNVVTVTVDAKKPASHATKNRSRPVGLVTAKNFRPFLLPPS